MSTRAGRRLPATLALVAWFGGLAASWWFLRAQGDGALAAPPVRSFAALEMWIAERDEAEIVMALLRLAGLACVGYLLALSVAGSAARLAGMGRSRVDHLSPRWLVDLLDSALGIGLAAALGLASLSAPNTVVPASPPAEQLADAPRARTWSPMLRPAPRHVPILRQVGPSPPVLVPLSADGADDIPAPDPEPASGQDQVVRAAPDGQARWTVEPGDHFWSIAVSVLADEWGRPPTTSETEIYWRRLVAGNRARLVDPTDPDLILPGQELVLPPTSPQPVCEDPST